MIGILGEQLTMRPEGKGDASLDPGKIPALGPFLWIGLALRLCRHYGKGRSP